MISIVCHFLHPQNKESSSSASSCRDGRMGCSEAWRTCLPLGGLERVPVWSGGLPPNMGSGVDLSSDVQTFQGSFSGKVRIQIRMYSKMGQNISVS